MATSTGSSAALTLLCEVDVGGGQPLSNVGPVAVKQEDDVVQDHWPGNAEHQQCHELQQADEPTRQHAMKPVSMLLAMSATLPRPSPCTHKNCRTLPSCGAPFQPCIDRVASFQDQGDPNCQEQRGQYDSRDEVEGGDVHLIALVNNKRPEQDPLNRLEGPANRVQSLSARLQHDRNIIYCKQCQLRGGKQDPPSKQLCHLSMRMAGRKQHSPQLPVYHPRKREVEDHTEELQAQHKHPAHGSAHISALVHGGQARYEPHVIASQTHLQKLKHHPESCDTQGCVQSPVLGERVQRGKQAFLYGVVVCGAQVVATFAISRPACMRLHHQQMLAIDI